MPDHVTIRGLHHVTAIASGAQAISLATGRSLTLVDTADGIRYKLELLSAS